MITLKAIELVSVWNALGELQQINTELSPAFTGWIKRFAAMTRQETEAWNQMSLAERDAVKEGDIHVQIAPLDSAVLPEVLYSRHERALQLVVNGEISVKKPQLIDMLDKKNKNKPKES